MQPKAPPLTGSLAVVFVAEFKECPLRAGASDKDIKAAESCAGFDGVDDEGVHAGAFKGWVKAATVTTSRQTRNACQ